MMTRTVRSLQARMLEENIIEDTGIREMILRMQRASHLIWDATLPGSVLPFLCHPFWDHCRMLPLV